MLIAGLQKLTLLDFPGHLAATVFTPGCNLRCPFCHNASLVLDPKADEFAPAEVISFLQERKGRLNGLAITGGEPLLQPDIVDFIRAVKGIGYPVKLDTNGTYPEKLKAILDEGLVEYVAMDLKNSWESYPKTVGLTDKQAEPLISNIKLSMEYLRNSGIDFEFRTTIVKQLHTEADIECMAKEAGTAKYFLQSFKDSGDILGENCKGGSIDNNFTACDKDTLEKYLTIAKKFAPNTVLRGVD